MGLTEKQRRFCDAYLANGCNATQAAIEAGYSKKTAYSQGQRMLKNVEVSRYIQDQSKKVHDSKVADAQELFEFWTAVMRGDEKETVVASNGKVVEVPVSIKDRIKASELRGKALGTFSQNVNLMGAMPVVITDDSKLED